MNGVQTRLTDAQMDDIVARIEQGMCVPFLGAAANVQCSQPFYEGLPLGRELAAQIFQKLGYRKRKLKALRSLATRLHLDYKEVTRLLTEAERDKKNLARLTRIERVERLFTQFGFAQPRENDLGRLSLELDDQIGRPGLNRFLKEAIPYEHREPSPLLKSLAKLPFKLIITTNYDCLMETALKGKDLRVIVHNSNELPADITDQIAGFKGPILYKIHGTLSDRLPGLGVPGGGPGNAASTDKVIITEDDYIEFLSAISDKDRGIPNIISGRLTLSTLLFFGYSLEDWDFRVIYKSLIEPLKRSQQEMSYAFQKHPPAFWVSFWRKKGITIVDMDLYDFAEELSSRFPQLNA